jgi:hypothetical protein
MEIAALSNSWIKELLRYQRSRVPVGIYLPLALFLSAASFAGGRPSGVSDIAMRGLVACTLLMQFRLWDDLGDLEHDRIDHPDRVLSRTHSLTRFRAFTLGLFAFNTALLGLAPQAWQRLLVFVCLNGGFFAWYRWLRLPSIGPIAGSHVVLIKYPIFVYLLSAHSSEESKAPLFLVMALVYLCFCVHEIIHDVKFRAFPGAHRILAVEMLGLNGIMVLMAITLLPGGGLTALLQWLLTAAAAVVLAAVFQRYRTHAGTARWNYAVFLITLPAVLIFALGPSQ